MVNKMNKTEKQNLKEFLVIKKDELATLRSNKRFYEECAAKHPEDTDYKAWYCKYNALCVEKSMFIEELEYLFKGALN